MGAFELVPSDPRPARASAEVALRHDRPSRGGDAQALGRHSETAGRSVEPGEETFAAHVTVEFLLRSR